MRREKSAQERNRKTGMKNHELNLINLCSVLEPKLSVTGDHKPILNRFCDGFTKVTLSGYKTNKP